jgi:hypothetical protein
MGLGVNKDYKGLTLKYASIISLFYSKLKDTTEIKAGLYANENEMKNDAGNFLKSDYFTAEGELNREEAYTALKNANVRGFAGSGYFKDATDVGKDS